MWAEHGYEPWAFFVGGEPFMRYRCRNPRWRCCPDDLDRVLRGFERGWLARDNTGQLIVRRIRRIGVDRMLFGIDRADAEEQVWQSLTQLPLTPDGLRRIATNLAPYLRP